ncbi:MAG: hypothetical protein WBX25_03815 [Rhodomicrobium sp.]
MQTTYLQASLVVIQAQTNRYADTVGHFQALAGAGGTGPNPPHVEQPEARLTSVVGAKPDPIAPEYLGASRNEAR